MKKVKVIYKESRQRRVIKTKVAIYKTLYSCLNLALIISFIFSVVLTSSYICPMQTNFYKMNTNFCIYFAKFSTKYEASPKN